MPSSSAAYIYIHIQIHICTQMCMHSCKHYNNVCVSEYTRIYINVNMHIWIWSYIYESTHTYMNMHMQEAIRPIPQNYVYTCKFRFTYIHRCASILGRLKQYLWTPCLCLWCMCICRRQSCHPQTVWRVYADCC